MNLGSSKSINLDQPENMLGGRGAQTLGLQVGVVWGSVWEQTSECYHRPKSVTKAPRENT